MTKRTITPEDLLDLHFCSDPQISPDGSLIAFAKGKVNDKNSYNPQIFSVHTKTKAVNQLTQGQKGCGLPRWSPDGSKLAFISGREGDTSQIFLLPMSGGEGAAITQLPEGSIRSLKWSPDGSKIAFEFRPSHPDRTQRASEERKEKGLSTPPWEITSIWYRLDGDGYFGQQRYAIYLVDLNTQECNPIYSGCPVDFYSYDWLPDSNGIVVAHSANQRPLFEKPNDQLFLVDLNGNSNQIPNLPKGPKSNPVVSPCGEKIAFLGHQNLNDPWGTNNQQLFVVNRDGSGLIGLTENQDYCLEVASLSDCGAGSGAVINWLPDGSKIQLMIGWHGESHLAQIPANGGTIEFLTTGEYVFGIGNTSKNGESVALTRSSWNSPTEIAVLQKGTVTNLTSFNQELLERLELSQPSCHWVDSTDGVKVQAWHMPPVGKNQSSSAILEIHGEPHTQYSVAFFHEFQVLCAQGYHVFFSNPRGSKGYGEAFCHAIHGNWGEKDWQDVEAVTNFIKNIPGVDSHKIGIMGGSYGGYMTNWAISHSQDYRAAITDRCVSNWLSMAGNSDFPMNSDDYFGGCAWGPYDQIEKLWQQSPISYFQNVKTPTLIIHSEGDLRCNVEQSDQVFHALLSQGIETKYVRYPVNTSHGMSRNGPPDLRLHRLHEIINWWRQFLN